MVTRVIRNNAGLYLKQDGAWTAHLPEALKFADTSSAIWAKKNHQLEGVHFVLVIGDEPSHWDVVMLLL